MKNEGIIIISVEMSFTNIFSYIEKFNNDDPTWGLFVNQGVQGTYSALKRLVLSLIPNSLVWQEVEKIVNYAVKDINNKD